MLAMNQDLQNNAEDLFNYCELEGGEEMDEIMKCLINAIWSGYSKKELNKLVRLYKSDSNAADKFQAELY